MSTLQLVPNAKRTAGDAATLWNSLRDKPGAEPVASSPKGSSMEADVRGLWDVTEAPPRTLHHAPLVKSSPLSPTVRAMIEAREFGRRFDTHALNTAAVSDRLPGLVVRADGDVPFWACDSSLEELSLSVDGLLQHRKRLLAPSVNSELPRKNVFIVGAGPAGLLAAIELALRNHRVVVCELREMYSRNRYIGVYKEVTHLMAALGMPESMTYDFSQYRGKRGIMLADIQTFLHGVALKLGVIIYTGTEVRNLDAATIRGGEVELERAVRSVSEEAGALGITRWEHDTIARVSSGVKIRFDTIVEATGGRSGLRETLVGKENVVSMYDLAHAAAQDDPSLKSYFEDPEDHCAEYVDSDYGVPPELLATFAKALSSGDRTQVPDELPCFVSNIDATVFTEKMRQTDGSLGMASQIGDRTLDIPHEWVVLECRLADGSLSRYHIEGPLPQTFEFGGEQKPTGAALDKLNPVSFLLRILYAMGLPFGVIDRQQLVEFYTAEASRGDASDIVSTWVGRFQSLRVGGEKPIWCGTVPGTDSIGYAVLGEAFQNAWYRFGVGVDDAFTGASLFAASTEAEDDAFLEIARKMERIMRSRSVQVQYHLFAVARDKTQGVVGSVLTEYHMEDRHTDDVAEARLRSVALQGQQMLATQTELIQGGSDELLDAGLAHLRDLCCQNVLNVLASFSYLRESLDDLQQLARRAPSGWRAQVAEALSQRLSDEHAALVAPLFESAVRGGATGDSDLRQERLTELAMGRYAWVSPWVRACALRALDPKTTGAQAALTAAAGSDDRLIAQVANRVLGAAGAQGDSSIIDKVVTLRDVSIFSTVPHELLVNIAMLLTERWAEPGDAIIRKGEHGDSLYVISSGKVRVHDGERTFREMSDHEFFGELSLLDAEPRSASVSAIDRTHLLRLAQDDFYTLVGERPEITRDINRALCRLIRNG